MKNTALTSLDYLKDIYSAYHATSVETSYISFPFGKGVYSHFDRDGALSDALFHARIHRNSFPNEIVNDDDATLESLIESFDVSYEADFEDTQYRIWQKSPFAQFMLFVIDPMFRGKVNA